jgi:hypothetical protein
MDCVKGNRSGNDGKSLEFGSLGKKLETENQLFAIEEQMSQSAIGFAGITEVP